MMREGDKDGIWALVKDGMRYEHIGMSSERSASIHAVSAPLCSTRTFNVPPFTQEISLL